MSNNPDEIINTKFPLFHLLLEKTDDTNLTELELIELVENCRKMDRQGFDLLFLIIRLYSLKSSQTNSNLFEIPYSGQKVENSDQISTDGNTIKSDIKFDIRNFPSRLNKMLLEFSRMHLQK